MAVGSRGQLYVLDSVAEVTSAAHGLATTFLGPLALLLGMIGLLMTAVVPFMRSALLYLVAAFAPILGMRRLRGGAVVDARRASGR